MTVIAIIIFTFSIIQLAVALFNLCGKASLPQTDEPGPAVSVLIPARNEEATLPSLLSDLTHLPVPPDEIIICDDHSTDSTYAIAAQAARTHPNISVFHGAALPPEWQGKNYACHQLAARAKGSYLLFLDADVRISGNIIRQTMLLAQAQQLGLLSVFPRQVMATAGEKTTVPLMTYILLTLLPLPLVRLVPSQSGLSAANGQFMLFEAAAYRSHQPHQQVRSEATEDIAISRLYKKSGIPVACVTGIPEISCRMYHSWKESVTGFSRTVGAFFGNSLIAATLFWGITTLGWIPAVIAFPWTLAALCLLTRAAGRVIVSLTCGQNPVANLLLSPIQQINLGIILLRAGWCRINGQQEWKGRNILTTSSIWEKKY